MKVVHVHSEDCERGILVVFWSRAIIKIEDGISLIPGLIIILLIWILKDTFILIEMVH